MENIQFSPNLHFLSFNLVRDQPKKTKQKPYRKKEVESFRYTTKEKEEEAKRSEVGKQPYLLSNRNAPKKYYFTKVELDLK